MMFAPFNDLFEDGLIDLWHNVLDAGHGGGEQGTVSLHWEWGQLEREQHLLQDPPSCS